MSKQTGYILGILATIILGTLFYYKFCCSNLSVINTVEVKSQKNNTKKQITNNFNLSSENFEYTCDTNFNFNSDIFNFSKPVDKCIDEGIKKLKIFFDKNPNAKLKITGYCAPKEKNSSAFPNLGFARANDVKNYFISNGIASSSLEIDGQVSENIQNKNGVTIGPITYLLSNDIINTKGKDWSSIKEKINTTPLILYFNTNQSEINLTEEERKKIVEISNYLDNVKDAKVVCIGHTDNVGDRNVNLQLGQSRANFVKEYLSKNGINPNYIEINSKGPDEPISNNLTPEGRAKNRRTVITLK